MQFLKEYFVSQGGGIYLYQSEFTLSTGTYKTNLVLHVSAQGEVNTKEFGLENITPSIGFKPVDLLHIYKVILDNAQRFLSQNKQSNK